jgi:hypothetical protein
MTRVLLQVFLLLPTLVSFCSAAPSLTPEQRALILGKPGSVSMKEHVTRIPLEGTDYRGFYRCPYMQVSINGQGPYTFLFDTGSSYTIVSSKVIKAAGIRVEVDRGGYHDLVRVEKMRVGELEIEDLVGVRDDDFGVDGVFGFKAFGDMNVVFELKARQLLVSTEPESLPGSFEIPFELPHNVPVIPVRVGTAQVATLIDTGDDAYAWEVRSEDLKGATLVHPPTPAVAVLNGANSSLTYISTLESTIRLGPLVIERAVVGINDALPVPDFGVDFLEDFNIEFEPKRMIVTFQPLASGSGTKIRGDPSLGFTLRFDGKGTVNSVVPGSAAERHGMHSGDRVLTIEGRSIQTFDPRAWDQALSTGKPLAVRWLHETKERTDRLPVTELH